jgi:ADP-heptose:LPS heptosyltransferase
MSQLMNLLRLLKRLADRAFFSVADSLYRFGQTPRTKTLLIVRTDGIGDFVYFTRYLRTFREFYPAYRIVFVCRIETAPIAANVQFVDNVVGFKHFRYRRDYAYRLRILRKIRSFSPEVALYASYRRQHIGDEMTLLSGASTTVAFSGNDECIHSSMRLRNNAHYTRILEAADHSQEREKYTKLMKEWGIDAEPGGDDDSFLNCYRLKNGLTESAYALIRSLKRFVVIAPGASAALRRWPAERFVRVANALVDLYGLEIVLCGNSNDEQILRTIARNMEHRAVVVCHFTIVEVVELLKKASCFIGNDSGLLHLAASVKTASIGIIGGGHFSEYFPYGTARVVSHPLDCYECNWSCRYPEPYCLTNIGVDDVLRAVKDLHLS